MTVRPLKKDSSGGFPKEMTDLEIRTIYSSFAPAQTIYVATNGNDITGDGSFNNPYKSVKKAFTSITDASSTKRYCVKIANGFYYEENPITLKNYVYTQGDFKHNPRIIPLYQDQPLFTHPLGYTAFDFGELTFVAPDHNFIFYAGPGSFSVGGFYYNLYIAGVSAGAGCGAFHHEEELGGFHNVNCMCYSSGGASKFDVFADMVKGNYRDTGMHIHTGTTMNSYLDQTGPGHSEIDLMLTDTANITKMYCVSASTARFMLSNQVSSNPGGDAICVEMGTIRIRNSDLWGECYCGEDSTVGIQTSEFLNDGYINAYKPDELIVTQCRNLNLTAYCLYCLGDNTRIHTTGNSFVSPTGIKPVQLDGTFISIETQGVSQYDVASLTPGSSQTFVHLPDLSYARVCQISRYSSAYNNSLDFDLIDEANYYQEDTSKTDFVAGQVQLAGLGFGNVYAHWMLNESSGTSVSDSSGNGRNGTTINMEDSDWTAGKLNNCLVFDGVNEYVNCGNIAAFERTQAFSVEFWLNTVDNEAVLISKLSPSAPFTGWDVYLNGTTLSLRLINTFGSNQLIANVTDASLVSGVWKHVVLTYSGNSLVTGVKCYIDNVSKTVVSGGNTLSATIVNSVPLKIGGATYGSWSGLQGRMDEILIYDKELSAYEVSLRWNTGTGTEGAGYDTSKGWYIRTNTNQIDTSSWFNIGKITLTQTTPVNTDIRYLFSVDNRVTWKKWNGAAWETISLSNIDTQGLTKTEIESLTDSQWSFLFVAGTLDVVASLKTTDATATPLLDLISINYMTGYRHLCYDADLVVEFTDATHTKITNTISPPETLYGLKVNVFMLTPF